MNISVPPSLRTAGPLLPLRRRSGPRPRRLHTEVLVIGSGAGGAVTAATLAEAGREVLLLEDGPPVERANLPAHRPEAVATLYRNGGLTPILGVPTMAFVEGRCLGGSTEINSGFWHRLPPEVAERWRVDHFVRELSADQTTLLSLEIEREIQIGRLPSGAQPASSAMLRAGAEAMGWGVEEVARAQTGDLRRSAFEPGLKRSMSRTYLPRAVAAGAKVLTLARATQLHWQGDRVQSVSAVRERDGLRETLHIQADHVFVCGGAIQTPALLRRSHLRYNIGERLRVHPMLKVAAVFDHVLDSHTAPLPVYQVTEFRPQITLGGSVFTPGYLAMTLAENWEQGRPAMEQWRQTAMYYTACRGEGLGRIRVVPLTGEPLIRYTLTPRDRRNLADGFLHLAEALFAAGAIRLHPAVRGLPVLHSLAETRALLERPLPLDHLSLSTVHVMSSCPAGEDDVAAVDSFGRVHGFANLRISDASILPDSPGVNPQGSIMALALRNARRFLEAA